MDTVYNTNWLIEELLLLAETEQKTEKFQVKFVIGYLSIWCIIKSLFLLEKVLLTVHRLFSTVINFKFCSYIPRTIKVERDLCKSAYKFK